MSATQLFANQQVQFPKSIWYMGSRMTFHADGNDTDGQYALVEFSGKPGLEPPLHVHQSEDELFFVLEGQLRIFRGTEEHIINAGESLFLPRRVPHTFKVLSGSVRGLVLITPAGFEDYFREIGTPASHSDTPPPFVVDVPRMTRVATQFGVEFVK
jgi:quercetin dioxygenase-like cupin family protein